MRHFTQLSRGLRAMARRSVAVVTVTLLLGTVLGPAGVARAQLADDPSLTIQERRDLTLQWLDRYLTESELLRKADMDKIRAAVERMSPSQLEQWLNQTKDLRAYIDSDKWQTTKDWLRGYLRVQAMYSEAEIQKLRNDLINADAAQMLTILKRIQIKHDALVWMHEAAEKSRQISILQRDESVAAQEAATLAVRAAQSDVVATEAQADAPRGGKNRSGYQTPGGLINARDMSRATVWAQVWGPTWYIGPF